MVTAIVVLSGVILLLLAALWWCAATIKWQNKRLADYETVVRPPELVIDDWDTLPVISVEREEEDE